MSDPSIDNFNPGGVQDRVDTRDFDFSEVGFGTSTFNWDEGFDIETELSVTLPVKDQGGSFSCGGQAWASYAAVLEAAFTGTHEERSAKFLYAQTYQKGGGSTGRDNANIFINQGVSRETVLTSYENGQTPSEAFITRGQDITETSRNDALFSRGISYSQVGSNINDVARALRDNTGVILGIDGQNNGTWTSAFPKPPTNTEWRHWVFCGKAKKINGVKHVAILNSWGVTVGEGGWQWLSETYFTSGHIWSGWTHSFNPAMPPITFTHNFKTDLRQGMSGDEVKALQMALQLEGVFPMSVPCTGFFGKVTLDSAKRFQLKYGIVPVAGFVGPLTRSRLNLLFNR